ncbi:hypothetical protein CEXT_115251 [Caerostris extrusa]|uniref:Uncharacterized protein n=1 Tax=Caerostris extrusa TaxID=172846 RepID=A0AAV4Y6L5_CAEEX|nr:hypothetical protein CEXT_115251 [Caerostris extrusa]
MAPPGLEPEACGTERQRAQATGHSGPNGSFGLERNEILPPPITLKHVLNSTPLFSSSSSRGSSPFVQRTRALQQMRQTVISKGAIKVSDSQQQMVEISFRIRNTILCCHQ